ncbi:hypothetical protein BDZ89DRAFT_1145224 [Hymenopellis radicata]|nr:hypothetical protein BDZ89DRAFT_1145224 [Hymenopellis radicata]
MPSQSHFDQHPFEYRDGVLGNGKALVADVEPYSSCGWARTRACVVELYDILGFSVDNITEKVSARVKNKTVGGEIVLPRLGQFEELLLGYADQIQHH